MTRTPRERISLASQTAAFGSGRPVARVETRNAQASWGTSRKRVVRYWTAPVAFRVRQAGPLEWRTRTAGRRALPRARSRHFRPPTDS
ncbi:hypothetical protein GCM10022233_87920 [Streptomyces shaanxiensis]|uniref:Uncharacterized protein n=1 Tax=Streptomyces shaanxiensis TaxID=653357 RepID=A0ABP7WKP6_9ACTN